MGVVPEPGEEQRGRGLGQDVLDGVFAHRTEVPPQGVARRHAAVQGDEHGGPAVLPGKVLASHVPALQEQLVAAAVGLRHVLRAGHQGVQLTGLVHRLEGHQAGPHPVPAVEMGHGILDVVDVLGGGHHQQVPDLPRRLTHLLQQLDALERVPGGERIVGRAHGPQDLGVQGSPGGP